MAAGGGKRILVLLLLSLSSSPLYGSGAGRSQSCSWEVSPEGGVGEIMLEVHPQATVGGKLEALKGEEMVTVMWYCPHMTVASVQGMSLKIWDECEPLGVTGAEVPMSLDVEGMGDEYASGSFGWLPGQHRVAERDTNRLLAQLVSPSGQVRAQGVVDFTLSSSENRTEGALLRLSRHGGGPDGGGQCSSKGGAEDQEGLLGCEAAADSEGYFSRVVHYPNNDRLDHSLGQQQRGKELLCSLPRAPLRVYEVRRARWFCGVTGVALSCKVHVWLPFRGNGGGGASGGGHGGGGVGECEGGEGWMCVHRGPMPETHRRECGWSGGGDGEERERAGDASAGAEATAFHYFPGVGSGSVEHFGHFLLDAMVNTHRVQRITRDSDSGGSEAEVAGSVLLVDSTDDTPLEGAGDGGGQEGVRGQVPARRFYEMVGAVAGGGWKALGELAEGQCMESLSVGFGALELMRAKDARDAKPHAMHNSQCGSVVRSFRKRVFHFFNVPVHQAGEGKIIYLKRGSGVWRRLKNEDDLIERWNRERAGGAMSDMQMHTPEMEKLPMAEQLAELSRTRLLVGVNGGQINAVMFLPSGATCALMFPLRWADSNFGYVHTAWLLHSGVRYLQLEAEVHTLTSTLGWELWQYRLQHMRDADFSVPYGDFEQLVLEGSRPASEGGSRFDASDDTGELEELLHHMETTKLAPYSG